MHGKTNTWSLSTSQCSTCFTHLPNLPKILISHGCLKKDMEMFRSWTRSFDFKRPLLMLLPRSNKIFVSKRVNLSAIHNLQHTTLASIMQHPFSSREDGSPSVSVFSFSHKDTKHQEHTPFSNEWACLETIFFFSNLKVNVRAVFPSMWTKELKFQTYTKTVLCDSGGGGAFICTEFSSPQESVLRGRVDTSIHNSEVTD